MNVVACAEPTGAMDPAPITSLALHMDWSDRQLTAFWTADDEYVIRTSRGTEVAWYRIEAELPNSAGDEETRRVLGKLLADVIPLGGGRVAFPAGSAGRRVYRVWRSSRGIGAGRTRILGVRAARSRRLPA